MTPAELRQLREALGLPLPWCAERIGKVSPRTWRYWESGRDGQAVAIPDDVADGMRKLAVALKPWAQ